MCTASLGFGLSWERSQGSQHSFDLLALMLIQVKLWAWKLALFLFEARSPNRMCVLEPRPVGPAHKKRASPTFQRDSQVMQLCHAPSWDTPSPSLRCRREVFSALLPQVCILGGSQDSFCIPPLASFLMFIVIGFYLDKPGGWSGDGSV